MNERKFLSGFYFQWKEEDYKYKFVGSYDKRTGIIEKRNTNPQYSCPRAFVYVGNVSDLGFFYCTLGKENENLNTFLFQSFAELDEF